MKLRSYLKPIFCVALLLCWGHCAPPAAALYQGTHPLYQDIYIPPAPQTVEVHTPRASYNAVFESEVRVFPNGTAVGFLTLSVPDSASRHSRGGNFLFGDGSVRFNRDDTVAGILLRGRSVEGNRIVVMITPAATEDCLIYTTVGSDVHATWEARGQIVVNR